MYHTTHKARTATDWSYSFHVWHLPLFTIYKSKQKQRCTSYHASISTVQSKKKTKITQWTRIHIYFRLTFFLGSSFMHTFFLCIDNILLNQNFVRIRGSFGKVNKKFKQNFETNKISGFFGGGDICVL